MDIKVLPESKVFILVFRGEGDTNICGVFASQETAIAEARSRNKQFCGADTHEAFDENGDFLEDDYDACDWDFYTVYTESLVL